MSGSHDIHAADRIAQLEAALAEASAKAAVLMRDNEALARENAELAARASGLESELSRERAEREKLVRMIRLAQARAFGARSEKVAPSQTSLFNDFEAGCDAQAPEPAAEDVARSRGKRKRQRRTDWSKFDTVVVEHRMEDAACPACGAPMAEMGYQVKRVFKVRPAHVYVEEHRQYRYVCPACSAANRADGGETPAVIRRAPMPEVSPVEGSCASASMVAYIMDRKYCMGMPVHRIAADLRAMQPALTLTRQAMSGWVIRAWDRWLSKVFALMRLRLMEQDALHIDETRIQVLREPGRSPTSMSWAWLFCTLECEVPVYIFRYDPSRGHEVPDAFLAPSWKGTIVTDGHSAYSKLMEKRDGDIVRVSCLVHALRKFKDVLKSAGPAADRDDLASRRAVRMIGAIFEADGELRGLPPEERRAGRERTVRPLMDAYADWLEDIAPKVMPGTLLDKAVTYSRNQFPYLYNALKDGRLPLDNNRAENAIRPFCVGRRAWLFSDTPAGAEASCGIYSIVTTARANGLSPLRYLEWLLGTMPGTPGLDDPGVLARFAPWSPEVPDSCRLTPAEADREDAMAKPYIDVDPHAMDLDEQ